MTYADYMERREAKLARTVEKRTEWAEKAEQRSNYAYQASNNAVAGIEPGQPILMGHHSQRKHQNALKRSDKAMTRCCEESKLAKHHENKAANAEYALEKRETPDFCVRRINEAETIIRKLGREGRQNEWHYANAQEKTIYWKQRLATIAPDWAAAGYKNPITPAKVGKQTHCKHKDFGWYEVASINRKTVTVKNWLGVATMTYKLPLEEIVEWKNEVLS
jgi:hypothetical protein